MHGSIKAVHDSARTRRMRAKRAGAHGKSVWSAPVSSHTSTGRHRTSRWCYDRPKGWTAHLGR